MRASTLRLGKAQLAVISFPLFAGTSLESVTPAERAVVERAARGESNLEIATARRTSVRTVANQLAAVGHKLGVSRRSDFVLLALGRWL